MTAYFAHTAENAEGDRLPESSGKWQPLAVCLSNVAELAARFAAPFGSSDEARVSGLLHETEHLRPPPVWAEQNQ